MRIHLFRIAMAMLALIAPAERGFAKCKLGILVELPVTMAGSSPTVPVRINGSEVRLVADSGAFYSMLTAATAAELKLQLDAPLYGGLRLSGVAGSTEASVTTVKQFTLGNVPIPRVEFIVGGSEPGYGAAGYLGQNVLGVADVEYDLANGAIRLMRGDDCAKTELAYWATGAYSVIDIDYPSRISPHTAGIAYVNGSKIHVLFDTGASTSILTLRAAAHAGITPGGLGVVAAGAASGITRDSVDTWIAPVSSFKIGDEEVRNTRLRIGDIVLDGADMLIGADFFLSHRVYVANSQRKLYFTYNGGPVFNLASHPKASPQALLATELPPATEAPPKQELPEPGDASMLSRRGAALTARGDYEHAIADLTRACELEPGDPVNFYERGVARARNQQPELAKADFSQAIQLRPDYVDALVARAAFRHLDGDQAGAGADLDAADGFAAKQADIRFLMARLYEQSGLFEPAVRQYTLWIAAHDPDAKRVNALNGRCWVRALWNHDLNEAVADCNAALRLDSKAAPVFDSRGLIRLRLGQFDKSIADYDQALRLQPNIAWSLYGRGIDKLRLGMTSAGQADIDAATALQPRLPAEAAQYGITP